MQLTDQLLEILETSCPYDGAGDPYMAVHTIRNTMISGL